MESEFEKILDTWKNLIAKGFFKEQEKLREIRAQVISADKKPACYFKFAADMGIGQPYFRIGLN